MYFVRFILFCTDAVNDFLGKNCPFIAGAISFYALFSFFPLVLAIISVAGFVVGTSPRQAELARDMAEVIPISGDFISQTVEGVVAARAITGVVSVLGLLWAATAAFGAIRKGINAAWGISKTRPFLRERLMDFGLVLGAGLLMMAVLFITPIFAFAREITEVVAPEGEPTSDRFWSLAAQLTTPLMSFAAFLILYRFLPNTRVRLGDVWLGALLASAAFEGAKWGVRLVRQYLPGLQCGVRLRGGHHGLVDLGIRVGYHTFVRRPRYLPLRRLCQAGARRTGR